MTESETDTEPTPPVVRASPLLIGLTVTGVIAALILPDFAARWFEPSSSDWIIGLLAGIPLLLAFYLSGELNDLLAETTAPLSQRIGAIAFVGLAIAFAIIEEVLFRGVVPDLLTRFGLTPVGAIVLGAAIYAAGYSVTRAAFVLMFLIGLYLSALAVGGESTNLIRPILAHIFFNVTAAIAVLRVSPSPDAAIADSADTAAPATGAAASA